MRCYVLASQSWVLSLFFSFLFSSVLFFILIFRRVYSLGSVGCNLFFFFFLTDVRVGVRLRPLKPKEKDPGDVRSRSFGTLIVRVGFF